MNDQKELSEKIHIVYYCKDCEKIVEAKQLTKKFSLSCSLCKGKNISFGSEKSIRNFYQIEEIKS